MPEGNTRFVYYPDRYAFDLLRWTTPQNSAVRAIKASPFARLLSRPTVKAKLAQHGKQHINADLFASYWPDEFEPYLLTMDEWNEEYDWAQTSRPGSSLVLQLNFSNKHDRRFTHFVKPNSGNLFNPYSHPYRETEDSRGETLAWSRIDLDLDAGEALIEEIQSDWVREASWVAKAMEDDENWLEDEAECGLKGMQRYVKYVLAFHKANWANAMLTATLNFLHDELGIQRIWIHDFETGIAAKGLQWSRPPRSLYTSLPKRFCFQRTANGPNFICKYRSFRRKISSVSKPQWHYLEL